MEKFFKILFILSLAINVFFLGFFFEKAIHEKPFYPQRQLKKHQPFCMFDKSSNIRQEVQKLRDIKREIITILEEDPLRQKDLEERFEDLRIQSLKMQEKLHNKIVTRAKNLKREERRQLFRNFGDPPPPL